VALQVEVLLLDEVLDDACVGRGLEELAGALTGQVVHGLHLIFVETYYFF